MFFSIHTKYNNEINQKIALCIAPSPPTLHWVNTIKNKQLWSETTSQSPSCKCIIDYVRTALDALVADAVYTKDGWWIPCRCSIHSIIEFGSRVGSVIARLRLLRTDYKNVKEGEIEEFTLCVCVCVCLWWKCHRAQQLYNLRFLKFTTCLKLYLLLLMCAIYYLSKARQRRRNIIIDVVIIISPSWEEDFWESWEKKRRLHTGKKKLDWTLELGVERVNWRVDFSESYYDLRLHAE